MSSIQAAAGVQAGGASGASSFSSMNSEEFVKIIFTELQNQDPFQPNDSSALLEQLNSIRSIESDMALTDQLKAIKRSLGSLRSKPSRLPPLPNRI